MSESSVPVSPAAARAAAMGPTAALLRRDRELALRKQRARHGFVEIERDGERLNIANGDLATYVAGGWRRVQEPLP